MPFTDVSANTGPGTDDPHPTGDAGLGPMTFMDNDLPCAHGEICLVDP